jgi:protoheme IX farnesyltransferase
LEIRDFAAFFKLRLAFLVVVSAVLGYFMGADSSDATTLISLIVGGFLVTGASNGLNQVIERNLDVKMKRTAGRPLPLGKMTVVKGVLLAGISGMIGVAILWFGCNPFSAFLGMFAMFSYAALYTPLKQISPIAVFVGAFPGAIPPMLGYVAATGQFDVYAGVLFAVQFIWQFPHFWAIAWVLDDDYKAGGFRLLPSKGGRDKASAFQALIYAIFLLPVSLLPWYLGMTGAWSVVLIVAIGLLFVFMAYRLYYACSIVAARQLMFASFINLPLLQLIYVLNKI